MELQERKEVAACIQQELEQCIDLVTTLHYAIEKFPEEERQEFMKR